MAEIKVQKISQKAPKTTPDDVIALFCYYFPQYKYHEARKLPFKRVHQMLKVAGKEKAKNMLGFMQIIAAPHTKKMKGIQNLIEHYKSIIEK